MRALPSVVIGVVGLLGLLGLLSAGCGDATTTTTPPVGAPVNPPVVSGDPPSAPAPSAPAPSAPAPSAPSPLLSVTPAAGALALSNCQATPLDIDGAGREITFRVDTRTLTRAHLTASARAAAETAPASFVLELAEGGVKLLDGWDVCVGQSPACFANLEMSPGLAERTFTLTIRPRAGVALSADVTICVLDPLE